MATIYQGSLVFRPPNGVMYQENPSGILNAAPWSSLDNLRNRDLNAPDEGSVNNQNYGFCSGVSPGPLTPNHSARVVLPLRKDFVDVVVIRATDELPWTEGKTFEAVNLTGAPEVTQHDPKDDATPVFLTATGGGATDLRLGFARPTSNPNTDPDEQHFSIRVRKSGVGGGNSTTITAEIWEDGVLRQTVFEDAEIINIGGGTWLSFPWTYSGMSHVDGSKTELRIVQTGGHFEGDPGDYRYIEIGGIRWGCELAHGLINYGDIPDNALINNIIMEVRTGYHPTNWTLRFHEFAHTSTEFPPFVPMVDDSMPQLAGDLNSPPWGTDISPEGRFFTGAVTVPINQIFNVQTNCFFSVRLSAGSGSPEQDPVIRATYMRVRCTWFAEVSGDLPVGEANITVGADAALTVTKPLTGEAAAALTATGALLTHVALAGTASVGLTGAGDLSLVGGPIDGSGNALVEFTATGNLESMLNMQGSASIAASAQGAITRSRRLSGDAALAFQGDGFITKDGAMSVGDGDCVLTFSATGTLVNHGGLAGSPSIEIGSDSDLAGTFQIEGGAGFALMAAGGVGVARYLGAEAPIVFDMQASQIVNSKPLSGVASFALKSDAHLSFKREDRAPEERWVVVHPIDRVVPVKPKDRTIKVSSQQRNP